MEIQNKWTVEVTLKPKVENKHVDTILLNCTDPRKSINNAFELPSMDQAIKYLQDCSGFPTKETRLKYIRLGNYSTWPGLKINATNKYFTEAEKTQKVNI